MKSNVIQLGEKSYIRSKVVMLPTEKQSHLMLSNIKDKKPELVYSLLARTSGAGWNSQHLYFLSDEEIKEGHCVYDDNKRIVEVVAKDTYLPHYNGKKKIIASTDESLEVGTLGKCNKCGAEQFNSYLVCNYNGICDGKVIPRSLPRPSNEFLQAYCKANGKIDEVLVELDEKTYENVSKIAMVNKSDMWENRIKVSPDNTITCKRMGLDLDKISKDADKLISKITKEDYENFCKKDKVEQEVDVEKLLEDASYWLSTAIDIFNGSSGLETGKGNKYMKMVDCKDKIQEYLNSGKKVDEKMYSMDEVKILLQRIPNWFAKESYKDKWIEENL